MEGGFLDWFTFPKKDDHQFCIIKARFFTSRNQSTMWTSLKSIVEQGFKSQGIGP